MSRRRSSLFLHVKSEPNPDTYPSLWEHRLRQRRPITQNPFEPEDLSGRNFEAPSTDSPGQSHQQIKLDDKQSNEAPSKASEENVRGESKNMDVEWGAQIPSWLNLFYDLAWTATFSALTSNNEFKSPWDSISYIVFFSLAWWMWVSHVLYCVDFYTDDWFHLLVIFLQLMIFGALAATTQGFDVSNYILHSPGSDKFESNDITTMTANQYGHFRLAKISIEVITVVVAISRMLLLMQHLRVVIYAKFTSRSKSYPLRLLVVPAALTVSIALLVAAFVITKRHGEEPTAAKIKYILWGAALIVEMVAHLIRIQWDINDGVRLRSHGSVTGRLCDITTIILGEGINAIAGTFYAIQKAPGFGGPTGTGIVCCAIIVFFLTYLYFEGAAPLKSVRRRAAWIMLHLPWLLSVILLLEGLKNQLLLTSFINSASFLLGEVTQIVYDQEIDENLFNSTLAPLLLKGGMDLNGQWQDFITLATQNATAANKTLSDLDAESIQQIAYVWYMRLELSSMLHTFINFMSNETISDDVQKTITEYQSNYTFALQDGFASTPTVFFDILWQLIKPSVDNGRYVMALCGLTFITLATLNLVQSWPRDRFHWASIISRYVMGFVMVLLLVLNVGKYQTYFPPDGIEDSQRAPVFNWIDTNWVLPTVALAYAIQFVVDTALVYVAIYFSRKALPLEEQPVKLE